MHMSAVILAGGRGSRFGEDKALIKYRNQTLLNRLLKELSFFDELMVSVADKGQEYDLSDNVKVISDENREIGPLEGIRTALEDAKSEYVFVCAVDMPFLTGELAAYMQEFVSSDFDCYVIKDARHFHPLCAIYSKKVLPIIDELISCGQYRIMELLMRARTKYIDIEKSAFSGKQITNVNTREELFEAVLPVIFAVSGYKDSGKTWLISKLINEFIGDGFSVGTIKHDGHDYVMDHEGSDTSRFYEAGVLYSAIFSPKRYTVNVHMSLDPETVIEQCPYADIVIVEGLKEYDIPKLFLVRDEAHTSAVPGSVFGIVSDLDPRVFDSDISCHDFFKFDEIDAIYDHIKNYFNLKTK